MNNIVKRKLRGIAVVVAMLLCCSTAFACGMADKGSNSRDEEGGYSGAPTEGQIDESADQLSADSRKIIYTASFTLEVDDITQATNFLRGNIEADEWFDSELIQSDYARFVVRVKSDRLDEFIEDASEGGEMFEYRKTATDVSIEYSNKQLRIDALNAERTRLLELVENANLNEILTINARLSVVEAEIAQLTRDLNAYNSLIDFSTVTITLTQTYVPPVPDNPSFGQQFVNVLTGAFKALGSLFKFIVFAITAIFPFALVAVPVTFGTIFLVKFLKRRKRAKSTPPTQE